MTHSAIPGEPGLWRATLPPAFGLVLALAGCGETAGEGAGETPPVDSAALHDTAPPAAETGKCAQVVCDPKDDTWCVHNLCVEDTGECTMTAAHTGAPCSDGDPCTHGDSCDEGVCQPGVHSLCACASTADCEALPGADPCAGVLYCDKKSLPWTCRLKPATAVLCDPEVAGPCQTHRCDSATGKCALQPRADGVGCTDGDPCTGDDHCEGGSCEGGGAVDCGCKTSADCASLEDGDACNGVLYCDKSGVSEGKMALCKLKPFSVVKCNTKGDSVCSKQSCDSQTGKCVQTPVIDKTPCDDGSACTQGDVCIAGSCIAGKDFCVCNSDADCEALDDGDKCNGTSYCDKSDLAKPTCKPNPASLVVCPTVSDTVCLKNVCEPKLGACLMTPREQTWKPDEKGPWKKKPAGKPGPPVGCDDGNPCTSGEYCKGGACLASDNTCLCKKDADCNEKKAGLDLCLGERYCDQSTKTCQFNPANAVVCPTVDDTICLRNACDPKTGKCVPTPWGSTKKVCLEAGCGLQKKTGPELKGLPCEDGDKCTEGDVCAAGKCVAGKNTCVCKDDTQCLAKGPDGEYLYDDGNMCNGLPFCNQALTPKLCQTNPATVKNCPTIGATDCRVNACVPKTGACVLVAIEAAKKICPLDKNGKPVPGALCRWEALPLDAVPVSGPPCDDNNPCTVGDACEKGKCVAGVNTGGCCWTKNDCPPVAGDLCKGQRICDKSVPDKPVCKLAPPVKCTYVPDNACLTYTCNPKTGGCELQAAKEGEGCDDGSVCTTGDTCKSGNCIGKLKDCDDKNPCTLDVCHPIKGCVNETVSCKGGGDCAVAFCNAIDGKCAIDLKSKEGKFCDDGNPCTLGDVCAAGKCKSGPPPLCKPSQPLGACEEHVCVPKGKTGYQCVTLAIGDGEPCSAQALCTIGATCKSGVCVPGKTDRLFEVGLGHKGWQGGLHGVVPMADGTMVVLGSLYTGPEGKPSQSAWWVAQVDRGGKITEQRAIKAAAGHVGHGAFAGLRTGGGDLVLVGGAQAAGSGLNLRVMRLGKGSVAKAAVFDKSLGFGPGSDEVGLAVAQRPGGSSLVVVGRQTSAGKVSAILVGFGADGQKVWDKVHADREARGVLSHGDGTATVVGTSVGGTSGWLALVDSIGQVMWQVHSKGQAGAKRSFRAVARVPAGKDYVVAGSETAGGTPHLLVQRFDATGKSIWVRVAKAPSIGAAVVASSADRFAVAGVLNPSGAKDEGALWSLDGFGNVQWARPFDKGSWSRIEALVGHPDEGWALAGVLRSGGQNGGLLVRTDAFGHRSCATAGKCLKKSLLHCDDKTRCTSDDCATNTGCSYANNDTLACEWDDACADQGACKGGKCGPAGVGRLFERQHAGFIYKAVAPALNGDGFAVVGERFQTAGWAQWPLLFQRVDAYGGLIGGPKTVLKTIKATRKTAYQAARAWVIRRADKEYVLGGAVERWSGAKKPYDGVLVGLDSAGTKTWSSQKAYCGWEWAVHDVVVLGDGSYVGLGSCGAYGGHKPYAIRVKSGGAMVWHASGAGAYKRTHIARAGAAAADGSIMVVGYSMPGSSNKGLWNTDPATLPLIARLEGTGKWGGLIQPPGSTTGSRLDAVVRTSDGGYWAAGRRATSAAPGAPTRGWMVRGDATGKVTAQHLTADSLGHLAIESLLTHKDGTLMAGGWVAAGVATKAWWARLSNGKVLWQRSSVAAGTKLGHALILDGKRYVAAGSAPKDGGTLLSFNHWGHTDCATASGCDDKEIAHCSGGTVCTAGVCK